MEGISLRDLRREELIWELLLRLPQTEIPVEVAALSTDSLLRLDTSHFGNVFSFDNIYQVFSYFDTQLLLSNLFDLQVRIHNILQANTSLTAHQFVRLKSRILHYKCKILLFFILYPGYITDHIFSVESLFIDIWNAWTSIDKSQAQYDLTFMADGSIIYVPDIQSVPQTPDMEVSCNTSRSIDQIPKGSSNSETLNVVQNTTALNTRNIDNYAVLENIPSTSIHSNLSPSVPTPTFVNDRNLEQRNVTPANSISFRLLDSPLLQLFSDRVQYSGNTFRNILDFLRILVSVKRKMLVWNLSELHIFQVLARFTSGRLAERVDYALLHYLTLEAFHSDILRFFIPSHLQQQLCFELISRGQRYEETLSDFVSDIKTYHAVFQVEKTEYQFVSEIMMRLNILTRVALPLMPAPTTYAELDCLISKLNSIQFMDRITASGQNSMLQLDLMLNMNCEDVVSGLLPVLPTASSISPIANNIDTEYSRLPPSTQQYRSRAFYSRQGQQRHMEHSNTSFGHNQPNYNCYRCGSSGHFVRACPFRSQRYARSRPSRPP